MADSAGILSVLFPSVLVLLTYLILFEAMRGVYVDFFAPRQARNRDVAAAPYSSLFGWIWGVWKVTDEELAQKSGFESVVYLRFMLMAAHISALQAFFGLIILVPLYSKGEDQDPGFEGLTLSNVGQSSPLLWGPAVMMWPFTLLALLLITYNYRKIIDLRHEAMKRAGNSSYTITITKIPAEYDSEDKILNFLKIFFPNEIAYVSPVFDLSELEDLTSELQQESIKLLQAETTASKTGKPVVEKLGCWGLVGEEVDGVRHHRTRVIEIKQQIRKFVSSHSAPFCHSAFVVFKTVTSATKAAGSILTDGEEWEIENATKPKDILWDNLSSNLTEANKNIRIYVTNTALFGLIVFWAIPVALGGALADVHQLGNDYSVFKPLASLPPAAIGIIEGFGPSLWRVILMILLVPILRKLLHYTGILKGSDLEKQFFSTFYLFLLVNIYFVTLISTSVFSVITEAIANPLKIFQLFGEQVPLVAVQMIQYMLMQGLIFGSQKILRINGFWKYLLFTKLARSDYERGQALDPGNFRYGVYLAFGLLIWTITWCYATVAPLILPFSFVYFIVDYFVNKYAFIQVHTTSFESYGTFWPYMIRYAMNGMVMGQVVLMAIIGLRFGYMQQVLLFPLPVMTYLYSNHLFATLGNIMGDSSMTLYNANNIDKSRNENSVKQFLDEGRKMHMWSQPCLRIDLNKPLRKPKQDPEFPEEAEEHKGHPEANLRLSADEKTSLLVGNITAYDGDRAGSIDDNNTSALELKNGSIN